MPSASTARSRSCRVSASECWDPQKVGGDPVALPEEDHGRRGCADDEDDREGGGGETRPGQPGFAAAPSPDPVRQCGPSRLNRPALHEPQEVLSQLRGRGVPLRWLAGDGLLDDRLQVPRYLRRPRPEPRRLLVPDLFDQTTLIRLLVGRLQGHEFIQRQPQAVNIGPGITLPLEPLRGHVADRAQEIAKIRQVIGIGNLGQPEISDPDVLLDI